MLMIPPPQLPAKLLGVEITSPAGNASENAMEFSVGNWLGFVIENVMDVESARHRRMPRQSCRDVSPSRRLRYRTGARDRFQRCYR